MDVCIDGKTYTVDESEFKPFSYKYYTSLKLLSGLGDLDREIGFLKALFPSEEKTLINFGISNGGYVPIECSSVFSSVYVIDNLKDSKMTQNIEKNITRYGLEDKVLVFRDIHPKKGNLYIMRSDHPLSIVEQVMNDYEPIVIADEKKSIEKYSIFSFNGKYLYIPDKRIVSFIKDFSPFIKNGQDLQFDNLLHLVMMVKNSGQTFREVLTKNLRFADYWTILDTGSTDDTVQTIKDVTKGKKGDLFIEPFTNFRDSRNRLLELAEKKASIVCKFFIVLDDTFVIEKDGIDDVKNVRNFLTLLRHDTYTHSFSPFVKDFSEGDSVTYASNRLLKVSRGLRYKYKVHEIIENNISVGIPSDEMIIIGLYTKYMVERTFKRKESDLKTLFDEYEETKDPRHLYYIADTYECMKNWEEAYRYYEKRSLDYSVSNTEEIYCSRFKMALIAVNGLKKDWSLCHSLFLQAYLSDSDRAEPLACIAWYYIKNNISKEIGYIYARHALEKNIPFHKSMNIITNVYTHIIPSFVGELALSYNDPLNGEKACLRYLSHTDSPLLKSYLQFYILMNRFDKIVQTFPRKDNPKSIVFLCDGGFCPWAGQSYYKTGLGGSESSVIRYAEELSRRGWNVTVFCMCKNIGIDLSGLYNGVSYRDINDYLEYIATYKVEYLFINRYTEYIPVSKRAGITNVYFVMHDTSPTGIVFPHNMLSGVTCLTQWHKERFLERFSDIPRDLIKIYPNGIDEKEWGDINLKKTFSFIYSSFPNRGLLPLLQMFPIIKARYPLATLDIFCDLDHYYIKDKCDVKLIKDYINKYSDFVTNHGWVSKKTLNEFWKKAHVWLYPCIYEETFCITALEAAISGTLAITSNVGALVQTVGDRGIIIEGDPNTDSWKEEALRSLFSILEDRDRSTNLVIRNRKWAEGFDYSLIIDKLSNELLG